MEKFTFAVVVGHIKLNREKIQNSALIAVTLLDY
jgi:hypothetical protein